MLNMLMGLPAGEMSPADADAMRRTMALYGLGSVVKGENAAPTLQSMMMMEMTRNKDAKERAERDRINSTISNIWDTPGASGAQVGSAPRRTSLGRDMGGSEPAGYRGGTVQHGGKTYDMGRSDVSDYASAIASVESGGRYDAVGPEVKGNRAYGKYQVMDFNIGPWTKEVLGRELTPQEFLASPEAQDAVFNAKFGSYVDKYGSPQDAASVWFSGRPMAQAGNASDGFTTVPEYVQRFTTALGQPTQGQGVRVASNDPSAGLGMIGGQGTSDEYTQAVTRAAQQMGIDPGTPIVHGKELFGQAQQPQQGQRVAQAMPETQMQPGALRMPFTPTGGRMEPGLGQQPQQPQQRPRTRTDWARIAQNIRNSNLPPEEKSRQFQQLRTMMQIERDQQTPDRKTAQDANGRMRYVDTGELVFPEVQQTPKATTLRQNIEWLMSPEGGGHSRAAAIAIAKGGTNISNIVNTGDTPDARPLTDKPPKGFQRRWDPERNSWVDEPIPGGEADRDRQQAAEKAAERERQRRIGMGTTLTNLQMNIDEIKNGGMPVTGPFGALLGSVPGTASSDWRVRNQQITTEGALAELQKMRENSPTGGAVGQLSDDERRAMAIAATGISDAQSAEEYVRAAENYRRTMLDIALKDENDNTVPYEIDDRGNVIVDGQVWIGTDDAPTPTRAAPQAGDLDFSNMGIAEIGQVEIDKLTPEQMDALDARMQELGL